MRDQLNKGEHLSTPLKQKRKSFFQGGETKRMKTRKIMASLLAFAMLLSIVAVPVGSADAASTNSVDRVVQVSSNYKFNSVSKQVYLRIEEKNVAEFGGSEKFRLKLTNAKWPSQPNIDSNMVAQADSLSDATFVMTRLSDQLLDVTADIVPPGTGKSVLLIPLWADVTGSGEITVTVEGIDSRISNGTLTFAVSAAGGSIATVDKAPVFASSVEMPTIVIDETRIDSLTDTGQKLRLRLPSGFEWSTAPVLNLDGTAIASFVPDGSTAEATVTIGGSSARRTFTIDTGWIRATSSARVGDVVVALSGGKLTSQSLTIAQFAEYGVVVKADGDPKELISGRWDGTMTTDVAIDASDVHKLQKLVIEENSANGWLTDRRTRIEFPEGIKIVGFNVDGVSNSLVDTDANFKANYANLGVSYMGKNFIELDQIARVAGGTEKAKAKFEFYVSVDPRFTGDIVATVTGQGVMNETLTAVLGKAVVPVTVEAEATDLRIGRVKQPVGDIVITENLAGAIMDATEKDVLSVSLAAVIGAGWKWNGTPTVTVEEGDIELDTKNIAISGNTLNIPIKRDSSKASKIVVSNGFVDLDRTVPEGTFNVTVGGTAIVQNNNKDKLDEGRFNRGSVASFAALNVITPAPGEERRTVKFNLDSKEYVVIEAGKEVTKTMDVAPYNENGRALLPIRFVAEALGVSEDNIVWNANTKEVTIFKGDRIAKVQIGSNVLVVNGTDVVMDTTASIKDGRTVLPIRFVGQALGANIGWDDATRTITVQQ